MSNSMETLKQAVIENLQRRQQKYPDDVLLIAGKGYTQSQLLKEIEDDTPLGERLINDMVLLTVDLLARGKKGFVRGKLKAIGITVYWGYAGSDKMGWWAKCNFEDFGHCDRGSIQGVMKVKYGDTIKFSIDTIKADVERYGIEFIPFLHYDKPAIFYADDGHSKRYPPPEGWQQMLRDEAERIGFVSFYEAVVSD